LLVAEAEAVVPVLEAELALRAGRSDAQRARFVGEVGVADRLHVLRRQAAREAEKAHARLESAGAGGDDEEDVRDEKATRASGQIVACRRDHSAASRSAKIGRASCRERA